MGSRFEVYQFFDGGGKEKVKSCFTAEEAVRRAKDIFESVGGILGTTKRVIITDDMDYCVFEWIFGEGVVFPELRKEREA